MKLKIKNVRLVFPQLFTAKAVKGEGDPAYSASFLIGKDDPQIKIINAAVEQVGKDKWGAKWPQIKKEIETKDRGILHDGDMKATYSGFEGNLYINARNKVRPTVADRQRVTVTESDGVIYGGCYVNAIVDVWAQDNQFGKRINASLMGAQFVKDGEPFSGGGVASVDDFEEIEEEALV